MHHCTAVVQAPSVSTQSINALSHPQNKPTPPARACRTHVCTCNMHRHALQSEHKCRSLPYSAIRTCTHSYVQHYSLCIYFVDLQIHVNESQCPSFKRATRCDRAAPDLVGGAICGVHCRRSRYVLDASQTTAWYTCSAAGGVSPRTTSTHHSDISVSTSL